MWTLRPGGIPSHPHSQQLPFPAFDRLPSLAPPGHVKPAETQKQMSVILPHTPGDPRSVPLPLAVPLASTLPGHHPHRVVALLTVGPGLVPTFGPEWQFSLTRASSVLVWSMS